MLMETTKVLDGAEKDGERMEAPRLFPVENVATA